MTSRCNDQTDTADESLVATRVAFFEKTELPITPTHHIEVSMGQTKESYVKNDETSFKLFLQAIGEDPSHHYRLLEDPKFLQLTVAWSECLEERTNQRQKDETYYHISDDLDILDAFVYADSHRSCSLEASAIQLLTSPRSFEDEGDCDWFGNPKIEELSSRIKALSSMVESWTFWTS